MVYYTIDNFNIYLKLIIIESLIYRDCFTGSREYKILFQSFFPIIFNYENDRFLLFLLKTDSLIPRALQDFLQENKVKASDISHTFYDLKPFIENFPSMLDLYENDFDYSSSYLLKLG
mgnify:FL=1